MRRRQHLQVNTFPFLAVLLCAMGSLILVLLVMDRRSKLAAQARAQEELRRQAEDQAIARLQRRQEHEAKKLAQQQAYEKKRDALRAKVNAEEKALSEELRVVQERLAKTAQKLREEEDTVGKLRQQIHAEQGRVSQQEQHLQTARVAAATLAEKAVSADKAREKLASEMVQLEKIISDLKSARQRDEQTFSVVPYHGKRGESRRPLYVECGSAGYVMHPDQQKLEAPTNEVLRAEVARRIAQQKAQLPDKASQDARPYLMLLVRPDGISRFYELQAAVRELNVDFGYEFVNAEWKFHVPADAAPPKSHVVSKPMPVASPGVRLVSPAPKGEGGAGAAGGGSPQTYANQPAASASERGGEAHSLAVGAGSQDNRGLTPPARPGLPGAIGLTRPVPYGKELPPEAVPGNGNASAQGSVVSVARPIAPAEPAANDPGITAPPILPNFAKQGTTSAQAAPGARVAASSGEKEPSGNTGGPAGPEQKPVALRPAQISGAREVIFFVECRSDLVIVHPTRTQIALDHLTHSPTHNRLFQTVRQLINRQLSQVAAGQPSPRLQVRFLIHRDGEQTFHRAYPVLETLTVAKTQYHLTPEDDVARIIAGY